VWLFIKNIKKEVEEMKKASRYATNKAGIIKAERPVSDQPKATVVKGKDLRTGNNKK
jgi:hypothetical protein